MMRALLLSAAALVALPAAAQDVAITNAKLVIGDGSAPIGRVSRLDLQVLRPGSRRARGLCDPAVRRGVLRSRVEPGFQAR